MEDKQKGRFRMIYIHSIISLAFIVFMLSGCESIDFLMEQNDKYEAEKQLKKSQDIGVDDEISIVDEIIAADGLVLDQEHTYVNYIGRTGQSIIDELFVVRRDTTSRYGDVLSYNGTKFFCDQEDICYALYVNKQEVLGISFPIARTKLKEIAGEPICFDEDYQFYEYKDFIIRVPIKNNEIKYAYIAKDFDKLVALMASYKEEESYKFDALLQKTKTEIVNKLGPADFVDHTYNEVLHYDSFGIHFMLKKNGSDNEAIRVLTTSHGAFGIRIGSSREFLDQYYAEPNIASDFYMYQYEDTRFCVFFENNLVSAIQVMTPEEASEMEKEINAIYWLEVN